MRKIMISYLHGFIAESLRVFDFRGVTDKWAFIKYIVTAYTITPTLMLIIYGISYTYSVYGRVVHYEHIKSSMEFSNQSISIATIIIGFFLIPIFPLLIRRVRCLGISFWWLLLAISGFMWPFSLILAVLDDPKE